MGRASDFNAKQITDGKFTIDHITELVRFWQASHHPLDVDGMAGDKTLLTIATAMQPVPFLSQPLPTLPDGRKYVITSRFKTHEPERPDHDGIDLFYVWRPGDKPDKVVDGGAAGKNPDGTPKWGVPVNTLAIAAAPGWVMQAGPSKTGFRCWIDHGRGLRSGYFHMLDLRVADGQRIDVGHPLGLVGDNPNDKGDARHLHFELSPVEKYAPMDPEPYLLR